MSSSVSKSIARKFSERIQARLNANLRKRLNGAGLTIYRTDWKDHVTPSGRLISRLRASAHPISANGVISGQSIFTGWVTASARDWKDTVGMTLYRKDGKARIDQLPRQAAMLDWSQPSLDQDGFNQLLRITRSGKMQIGYMGEMESFGQLNPDHTRWIMGYPGAWESCADMATQSIRMWQKSSSKNSLSDCNPRSVDTEFRNYLRNLGIGG